MPKFGPLWILLTVLYCSGIFYLSSFPDSDLPSPSLLDWPGSDKAAHATLYGGLAGLIAMGLHRSNRGRISLRALFLAPVALATLYGVSDELHQAFVPTRSPDMLDLLADAAGATIFTGAYTAWIARSARSIGAPAKGNSTRLPGD
jgi:VanZ family protein